MASEAVADASTRQASPMRPLKGEIAGSGTGPAREVDFSFGDLIDVVNPLQHIPVVSTIYRELTGDSIKPAASMAGDVLYGGPTAALGGLANEIARAETGRDLGELTMAAVFGGDTDSGAATQTAEAAPPARKSASPSTAPQPAPAAASTSAGASAAPSSAAPSSAAPASAGTPGPPRGNAALQALMRDLKAGGTLQNPGAPPANPDGSPVGAQTAGSKPQVAARSRSEPVPQSPAQAAGSPDGEANARGEAERRQQAAAPSSFMSIGEQDRIATPRARTTAAALRAEGDVMGSKRLQAEPKAERVTVPEPSREDTRRGGAGAAASEPTAKPAGDSGPAAAGGAPVQGDFAERMMRALERYEKMRAHDGAR